MANVLATAKQLGVWGAVFALLGVVAATTVTPSMVGWYNSPGQAVAMCDCKELARATAATIVQSQLAGLGAGFVLGVILGTVVMVRSRKAAAAAAPAAPASPPTEGQPPPAA